MLNETGQLLHAQVVNGLAPFWYGTPWDFNGTTEVPRQGSIACGYFVTTVLRDAGVHLDRVKLAQAASESMIKSLVSEASIRRWRRTPVRRVEAEVRSWGPGLYIAGLDRHTGFVHCDATGVWFIHAGTGGVVREQFSQSDSMASSRYRVLGKLTSDSGFLRRWLTGG